MTPCRLLTVPSTLEAHTERIRRCIYFFSNDFHSKELARIEYDIKPLDIVLIQTGADQARGTAQYLVKGAGMDRESTLYLTEMCCVPVKIKGASAGWTRPIAIIEE